MPSDLCQAGGKDYGFYRRLAGGKLEFVSFCSPKAKDWVSIHKDDLKRLLDKLDEGGQKELQFHPGPVKY